MRGEFNSLVGQIYEDKVVEMKLRGSAAWKLNGDDVWEVAFASIDTASGGLVAYMGLKLANEDLATGSVIAVTVLCAIVASLAHKWAYPQ